jgi:hypothetical protein
MAHDRDEFPVLDRHVHILERVDLDGAGAVDLADSLELDHAPPSGGIPERHPPHCNE